MSGHIEALQSFPVKGLNAVPHEQVDIAPGEGFPGDRKFGFAKGDSGFDPDDPKPMPKHRFLVLLEHEALAGLQTRIDPVTLRFDIVTKDEKTHVFDLSTMEGQGQAANFFQELLSLPDAEKPIFAQAEGHRFTDVSVTSRQMMNAFSLINSASVAELSERACVEIDPARFRGNILVGGWPPFSELDLVGRDIRLGDTTFRVLKRTRRCPATRVNPQTAERDLDVPGLIKEHYGHLDMGIYIEALTPGRLSLGDRADIM